MKDLKRSAELKLLEEVNLSNLRKSINSMRNTLILSKYSREKLIDKKVRASMIDFLDELHFKLSDEIIKKYKGQ